MPNAAPAARGVYKLRRPQAPPLLRLVSDHLHRRQTVYDDRLVREYGPWRPVVAPVTKKFLACGVLEHGFARIRFEACTHEYLLVADRLERFEVAAAGAGAAVQQHHRGTGAGPLIPNRSTASRMALPLPNACDAGKKSAATIATHTLTVCQRTCFSSRASVALAVARSACSGGSAFARRAT